jgi:hypothetical protein
MNPVTLFAQLGLPSAFVGMVLIAVIFKKTHQRVSAGAAVMAVCLVGVYGVIQLTDALSGRDIDIEVSPPEPYVFNGSGPVALEVSVRRGKEILKTKKIDPLSDDNFGNKLRVLGWSKPSAEGTMQESSTPQFWSTNRVYPQRPETLGVTGIGKLMIRAIRFSEAGEAVVTLELADKSQPQPPQLTIKNKGLDVQSFQGKGDFYIAVTGADFTANSKWATFSVFKTR